MRKQCDSDKAILLSSAYTLTTSYVWEDCKPGLYPEGLFPCSACLNTFSQVGLVVGHGTERELTVCLNILDLFFV